MWAIIAELGVSAGMWWLNKALSQPSNPNVAKALTQQPTSNEGMPVPLIFGQVRVRQPGLVCYGKFAYFAAGDGISGTGNNNLPVRYGINQFYVIGIPMHPTDGYSTRTQLVRIFMGDSGTEPLINHNTGLPIIGNVANGIEFDLTHPEWGMDTTQGGGFGTIAFFGGATDQEMSFRVAYEIFGNVPFTTRIVS